MTEMKMVYLALSKHLFYFRMHISKFVLERDFVPLNPFMIHDYFMLDTVDRDTVRNSNNTLVKRCDELWVFGPVSDGVLAEIRIAKQLGKPVRYFQVVGSQHIEEISKGSVKFEDGLERFADEL
ncbi:hypothetical protein HY501_03155 [Candidatus Woesearchaeota archaeon]|nr:hypothetical protein [Candidatus Woesearchaeota archaeon]